jgi:hypothetical protein
MITNIVVGLFSLGLFILFVTLIFDNVFVSRTKPISSFKEEMERALADLTPAERSEFRAMLPKYFTKDVFYKTLRQYKRQKDSSLPRFAEYLLYFLPKKDREPLLGDLEEEYYEVYKKFGKRKAHIWYYSQVAQSFWPLIIHCIKKLSAWGLMGWLGSMIRRLIP